MHGHAGVSAAGPWEEAASVVTDGTAAMWTGWDGSGPEAIALALETLTATPCPPLGQNEF